MAGEWQMVSLANAPVQIIDGDRGKNYPRQSDFSEQGHCLFLNAGNVTAQGFDFAQCQYITTAKDQMLRKGKLKRDDVVMTTRGTVGNVAYYRDSVPFDHIRINSGMVIFRADENRLNPLFLYQVLRSKLSAAQVAALRTGSAQPQLPIRDINHILIPVPPLPEQQAIAGILGALDDKIELNRRMNRTLEGIAQALFKSWFVDFLPVRAKAEGRDPSLPPHIAGLFPDEFEESKLGEIPKGWRVDAILAVADLLSGGTPSTKMPEYWDGDIKWVSAKDVSGARGTFLLDTERTITQQGVDNSSTKLLPELTTIVTARGTVGSYCILAEPMAMNQTNYGLKARREDADYFVFFALDNLVSQLKQRAYGTIFDTVTTRTFETSQIVVPGDAVFTEFDQRIRPLMERIRQNLRQSRILAALRDTLLPKLMSGELRVEDAERIVEETKLC
jgi:type I restriction enzyme S subunit